MTASRQATVLARLVEPTVREMAAMGRPFKGVLYAGLMLTTEGPKLIEYNGRFGDPECQVLLPRLKSDLLPALIAARDSVLSDFDLRWRDECAVCVVLAAQGYPDDPLKGTEIRDLEAAAREPSVTLFHAGTKRRDDRLVADGGGVLNGVALGPDQKQPPEHAVVTVAGREW